MICEAACPFPNNSFRKQSGISYVEILLAICIIGFLVLVLNNLPSSVSSISRSRHTSIAKDIATKRLEYLRKQPYTSLVNGTSYLNEVIEPNLSSLPSAVATYQIEDCPETICPSSEEVKSVSVKVSWNESGKNYDIEFATLVSPGGLGQ